VDIPADLPKVLVDRQRMEQVFLNLLDNAVKFTPRVENQYSGHFGKSLMCVLKSRITGSGSLQNIFRVYLNVFTGLTVPVPGKLAAQA
jgi:signal transduction histidine kinase